MRIAPEAACTQTFPALPRRRPVDHAFVELARAAHASLTLQASTPRHQAQANEHGGRLIAISVMLAVLGVTTAAVAAAAAEGPQSLATSSPADRCPTIDYVINHEAAPVGVVNVAHRAIARIADSTGFTFRYRGASSATSVAEVTARVPSPDSVLLVTWVSPLDLERRAGPPSTIGYTTTVRDAEGSLIAATIRLSAELELPIGLEDRRSWGGVVLHELGHLVGLRHSVDPGDLMHPRLGDGPLEWGPLEAERLRAIGLEQGCPGANDDSADSEGRR